MGARTGAGIGAGGVPLLLAWVALLAADRVDLLGTRGFFTLTPFLVLSPLVIATEWWRRRQAGVALVVPPEARRLLLLATLLLACATLSVFASRDLPRSAARLVQLLLMVAGSAGVLLSVRDRPQLPALLARGARWGLGVGAVVSVVQLLVLLGVVPAEFPASAPMVRLAPSAYAGIVPRLSGLVMDPNRTGLLLLLYGWLVATGDPNPARRARWLLLAGVLLLLTLSRSSLLAAAGLLLVVLWQRRTSPALPANAASAPSALLPMGALAVAVAAAALLWQPAWWDATAQVGRTVQQRFTVQEGSAQDHLRLLARGVELGTRTVPEALRGIGYGSAHTALQDFFPGDKYGNFHSLYVGAFAEMGVAGALAVVLLLAGALGPPATRALVVAAALFGVFYSVLAEPTFWVVMMAGWYEQPRD
jgi:hypothetical protein